MGGGLCHSWKRNTFRLPCILTIQHCFSLSTGLVLMILLNSNVVPCLCSRFYHIYHDSVKTYDKICIYYEMALSAILVFRFRDGSSLDLAFQHPLLEQIHQCFLVQILFPLGLRYMFLFVWGFASNTTLVYFSKATIKYYYCQKTWFLLALSIWRFCNVCCQVLVNILLVGDCTSLQIPPTSTETNSIYFWIETSKMDECASSTPPLCLPSDLESHISLGQ